MEIFFLVVLILLMALALGSGFPVAFALPGSAIIAIVLAGVSGYLFEGDSSAYFHQGGPIDWLTAGVVNFRGIYWDADRDTLIAIPLFVFMGIMLQRSKIAEDLLVTMARLFGPIPGGLGISVVFVGALLAATTGILGATVVAMGLISLPAMLRNNYSQSIATGTIAAAGTLGQIIPPSIVLIILADQLSSAVDQADNARKLLYRDLTGSLTMPSEFAVTSTSAGDMFLGAIIPGLVLVGLYMLYILTIALIRPSAAPSVRLEGKMDLQFWGQVLLTLVPPLALIFAVLGSILLGIATVNQAGAIGAAGATIMAGYRLKEGQPRAMWPAALALVSLGALAFIVHNFNLNVRTATTAQDQLGIALASISVFAFTVALAWSGWRTFKIDDTLRGVMIDTAKTTSLVFIILLGAAMLTSAFRAFGGEELVKEFLTTLPGGFWVQFLIVMLVVFVLGFFLDFIEIVVVVVPIVTPILLMDPGANVTAVWLGVMFGLNIQTSFLTPPFGFALFYLRGVAPAAVSTLNIYKGVIPFIGLQLVALGVVGLNPQLVNYVPTRGSLLAETAPPPQNPRLQHCIEQIILPRYVQDGDALRAAIARAKNLDVSYLPDTLRQEFTGSLTAAERVFGLADALRSATAEVDAATPAYRPLHDQARSIQRRALLVEAGKRRLEQRLVRSFGMSEEEKAEIRADIEQVEADVKAILATLPADWTVRHEAFVKLQTAQTTARRNLQRGTEQAYEPLLKLKRTIDSTEDLGQFQDVISALPNKVGTAPIDQLAEELRALGTQLARIEGATGIVAALNQARRALGGRTPNREQAGERLAEAASLYESDIAWRTRAARELRADLNVYNDAVKDTIGLRSQPRMGRDLALSVAACQANHRDVSLSF
ncbi:MAG: TRAP transporter large permease subunit [Hyphomicrobiaceae bacterium]